MTILLPRGIRNNNPGNIRISAIKWQGQRQTQLSDKDFIEFISPIYGVRAIMLLLLNYHTKYGLDTIESIINRYAPPCENATDHYIYSVSKITGFKRRGKINLTQKETLIKCAQAIVLHENGYPKDKSISNYWYDDEIYSQSADLALERKKK